MHITHPIKWYVSTLDLEVFLIVAGIDWDAVISLTTGGYLYEWGYFEAV